jgi:hypothetical protein
MTFNKFNHSEYADYLADQFREAHQELPRTDFEMIIEDLVIALRHQLRCAS